MALRLDPVCNVVTANGVRADLYLTMAPGKKQLTSRSRLAGWDRDVQEDLNTIKQHNVGLIIGLIEEHEYQSLQNAHLAETARQMGIQFLKYPTIDNTPFLNMQDIDQINDTIMRFLQAGQSVLIFCKGGLGRTGMLAACFLIRHGNLEADTAIRQVQKCRKSTIGRKQQQNFVRQYFVHTRNHQMIEQASNRK